MKIAFILFGMMLLSSCVFNGGKNISIEDAKKNILASSQQEDEFQAPKYSPETEDSGNELGDPTTSQDVEEISSLDQKNEDQPEMLPRHSIVSLDGDNPFIFDDLSAKLNRDHIIITGQLTSTSVDKIRVLFQNSDSSFPDDDYTLKKFLAGDQTFTYHANRKYEVLDDGKNEYTFIAHLGEEIYRAQITIDIPSEASLPQLSTKTKIIGSDDKLTTLNLPDGGLYGDILMLGESGFTYSQVSDFEVNYAEGLTDSCDDITGFLAEKINLWFYWNTCRPMINNAGITVNVLRLTDEEEYVYERHYLNTLQNLYGVYQMEKGTGVDKSNISDKNTLLKEKSFQGQLLVDALMNDIIKK